jgi:hypothetical protein
MGFNLLYTIQVPLCLLKSYGRLMLFETVLFPRKSGGFIISGAAKLPEARVEEAPTTLHELGNGLPWMDGF